MNLKKLFTADVFRAAFSWERMICRVIAAWLIFAAVKSFGEGKFSDLAFAQETSFSSVVLWVVLLFALFSAVNLILHKYESDSWFLMAAATLCVFSWALKYNNIQGQLYFMLALIVGYSMVAIYFVTRNEAIFSKLEPGRAGVTTAVVIFAIVSGAVISLVTTFRFLTFASPNFDFGLFCNMFYNMKESGLPLVTSERDVLLSHFVVHISPIYYLMLPFYYIFPSPITLQILQAVILASGVIPVALLCKKFKLSGKATIVISFIYAFYPALSGGCFYDLHENCFLTPLILWMFYFFEKEKYVPMYIFAVLVLAVKEDAAIYVILFALYVIISRKKLLHGVLLAAISVGYFVCAYAVLSHTSAYYAELYAASTPNPGIAGPMVNRFDNLIFERGDGLVGAVKTLTVNPGYLFTQMFSTSENGTEKLGYVLRMLAPLGFLPLCTKKASRWLLVAPILMNLLTMYKYQYDTNFHYQFGIIAFLVYAVIQNVADLKLPTRRNLLTVGAVACCCVYLVTIMPTVTTYVSRWQNGREKYAEMREILDTIPGDASVATTPFMVAHLADRDEIYELKYHGGEGDVDYVVIDMSRAYDQNQVNTYLNKGYVVTEFYEGKVMILEKTE